MEYVDTITMLYLGLGIYSLMMGTYLFLREETRLYGIVFYLVVMDEVAIYASQTVAFYVISIILVFWVSALLAYEISLKHTTEEEAEKIALYTGFAFANIAVLVLGLFVWNLLISISLSLLAFEFTIIAAGGEM